MLHTSTGQMARYDLLRSAQLRQMTTQIVMTILARGACLSGAPWAMPVSTHHFSAASTR